MNLMEKNSPSSAPGQKHGFPRSRRIAARGPLSSHYQDPFMTPLRLIPLMLEGFAILTMTGNALAEDWPQWLGPRRDGVWRESGIVDRFPTNGLKGAWRTPVAGGYSAPAVAGGRVIITDRLATTNLVAPAGPLDRSKVPGRERVTCLQEDTGKVLWTHDYDCPYDLAYPSGPRAMPQIDDDRVYTLGSDGHLLCLKLATGKVLWQHHFPSGYGIPTQLWGVASTPLIDSHRLICQVGGAGQSTVAFDKHTGRELWRSLDAKEPGYSSPILIQSAGVPQLIVWDTAAISSLNPETGKTYWSEPFPTKLGHAIATPRFVDGRLFITSFFDGSLMLQLDPQRPAASQLWRRKGKNENRPDSLHGLMSTPFVVDGYIYGVCGHGELRCLKADTGDQVWQTLATTTRDGKPTRWATAFLTRHADRFFLWNDQGELILAKLTPAGFEELSRTQLLEPTSQAGNRAVVWSNPAFANGHVLLRNDRELIRVDLRRDR